MKKLFFILTLIIWASNGFAQETSAQKKCRQTVVNPSVSFYTSYGKLTYDFSKSQKELTRLSNEHGHLEQGLFAQGLALIGVTWEVTVGTNSRLMNLYDYCVVPSSIDVFIGYTNPIIYISKELEPNSCEYNLVLRHEQAHHQINKTALDYFIPQMHQAIQKIARDVSPILVNSTGEINQATETINNQYSEKVNTVVSRFKAEMMKEQSKLDNLDNYMLEGELCRSFNKKR